MDRLTQLKIGWMTMAIISIFCQIFFPIYNAGILIVLLLIPAFIYDILNIFHEKFMKRKV